MTIGFEGLPDHWRISRLDWVATVNARIGWKALTAAEYQPSGYTFLATPNIKNREIDFTNVNYISEFRYRESPELQLAEGDVLLTKDGFTIGTVNIVRHLPHPATVNGSIAVLRPFGIHPGFLHYVIASSVIQELIWSVKDGMDVLHLFQRDIKKFPIPLPPLEEQRRIANFLDAETSRIDSMRRLRNEQLQLWNMRYQSILHSQFVASSATDEAGQDSTWLGRIPLGWTAPTIGRIARFTMGTTFPHDYQGQRQGYYPFIKVGDFQLADEVGNLSTAENWVSRDVAHTLRARIVPAGSILYARVGAALLLNRRRVTTRPSVIDDNVRAITFAGGVPHYWRALLSLLDMGQLVNPGPVPSIGESQVAAVRVPTPPAATQREIADRVEQHQRQLNQVTSAIQRQVNLLAERRQALITAAVTGQFDVTTASGRNVTDGVTA
ncbi:restriction endonuclease subunit S [Streptomyces sp. NPDC088260]|uniref:restriction endonuclease subunit S n=1 Tax=Streptomyces sp. NPDC088260 TaxID=3365850 RepID=UPI0038202C15